MKKMEFFAPTNKSALHFMFEDYAKEKEAVEHVAETMANESNARALRMFQLAQHGRNRGLTMDFTLEPALKQLDAKFWDKAMRITDVLDYMPTKRRDEWNESISECKTPEFTPKTVASTLQKLCAQRDEYLAEMVDGIFHGLSKEHVTNRPEGFFKRLIIDSVCGEDSWGSYAARKLGLVHDMRCVIARFMGVDGTLAYGTTRNLIEACERQTGQWLNVDGNAMRIRTYKKGTAHIEINPDIAYRLNQILAQTHPMAIPDCSRRKQKNKRKIKDFDLIERNIPAAVLNEMYRLSFDKTTVSGFHSISDKHTKCEIIKLLKQLGGIESKCSYIFPFETSQFFRKLIFSGVMPDPVSHQFYPTPESLAERVAEIANFQDFENVLEPSAGIGSIAKHIHEFCRVALIEISETNCEVLRAIPELEDAFVKNSDFLTETQRPVFDKIVMNPPFSQGRAKAHIEHAAEFLNPRGVLVAIAPMGMKNHVIDGFNVECVEVVDNAFANTSISVCILKIERLHSD